MRNLSPDRLFGRFLPIAVALLLIAGLSVAVEGTYAAFFATTSNGSNSFGSKTIFPRDRSISARDLRDASSGSEANKSDPLSYVGDALTTTSAGNMVSGSNTYLEFTMSSHLPAGRSVTGAQFKFSLASQGGPGSGNACFWFEVRSGGSVIGTHGSYASSIGCSSGNTLAEFDTSISEVSTTDIANGLVVRAYAWETSGAKKVKVDLATVTGTTASTSFTSYEQQLVDTSSGTVTTPWLLSSVDAVIHTSASAWPAAAATTKYLKLTFDPAVPSGAVISSATLNFVYKPSAAASSPGLCYYADVFQGTTLLGSHGSSSSAYSCNTSGTVYVTDAISLTEVNTAAKANALVVKLYMWWAGCVSAAQVERRPGAAHHQLLRQLTPTIGRDGDHRGSALALRHRGLAQGAVRGVARTAGRALLDDLGQRERAALLARQRRDRPRPRPRLPGRLSVHARRLPVDVPRPSLDDAAVRRLRHGRGDERALPLPARPRADRPLDGVRHADADGPRLRLAALARRGRPRGRRDRLARRHGDALRRHPARRGLDVDDDQLARGDAARVLHLRRRGAGRPARGAPRDDPDGHPQGVHRAEGVHLPARAEHAARHRHDRVLRAGDAQVAPDLDLRLPHPRGGLERARRSWRSRSPTASRTSTGRSSAASTSTTSRRASPSSSTRTSTSSRRSPSTAPRAGSGRASCASATARAIRARG